MTQRSVMKMCALCGYSSDLDKCPRCSSLGDHHKLFVGFLLFQHLDIQWDCDGTVTMDIRDLLDLVEALSNGEGLPANIIQKRRLMDPTEKGRA